MGEPARLANKIFEVAAFGGATEFWKFEHFSGAAAVPIGDQGEWSTWAIMREMNTGCRHLLLGGGNPHKNPSDYFVLGAAMATLDSVAECRGIFGCAGQYGRTLKDTGL